MRNLPFPRSLFALLAVLFAAAPLAAQYDDVYYTPTDNRAYEYSTTNNAPADDAAYSSNDASYNDEFYEAPERTYYDADNAASDYEYTSRIRRFRRPVGSFNYYDPFYVDAGYYDPFFRGGANTVLIYNTPSVAFQQVYTPYGPRVVAIDRFGFASPYSNFGFNNRFNSFNRFSRFNSWNDPFFYGGRGFGYAGYNNFGGFNRFGGAGVIGGGYYCPPAFGTTSYNNVATNRAVGNRAVTTRPRGSSTSISDRIDRNRTTVTRGSSRYPTEKSAQGSSRSNAGRSAPATRSANRPTTTRSRNAYPSTRSSSPSPLYADA